MREIGVELADRGVVALERPGEAGAIGVAEAVLAGRCRTCSHGRVAAMRSASAPVPSGEASSTIEHVDPGRLALEGLDEPVQRRGPRCRWEPR